MRSQVLAKEATAARASTRSDAAMHCRLVVESEWGVMKHRPSNRAKHERAVADDFLKLLYFRADARLLLTTCVADHRPRFLDVLRSLRKRAGLEQGEVCVWLWDYDAKWSDLATPSLELP